MRWKLLGILPLVLACAPRPQGTSATALVADDGLLDWTQVMESASDTGVVAQARLETRTRATAAARRVHTIEVTPRRLELVLGDERRVRNVVRVVGRDSAGRPVTGWAPYFLLTDAGPARFQHSLLMAVMPGTVELRVHPMVSGDSMLRSRPIAPVHASIEVVVKAPVYTPRTRPPVTPAGVLDAWVAALGAEQWADAARYVDLRSMEAHRRQRIAAVRAPLPPPGPTLEQYIAREERREGEIPPRAVLEWQFGRLQRLQRQDPLLGDFSSEFAGVTTVQMLADLAPSEVAARWLEARDPRVRVRAIARRNGCDSTATRRMVSTSTVFPRALGVVVVSDSIAWGLLTATGAAAMGREVSPSPVLLRRTAPDSWKLDLRPQQGYSTFSMPCPQAIGPR